MAPQASKQGGLLPPHHHRITSCTSNVINSEQVPGSFSVLTISSLSSQASAQSEKRFLTPISVCWNKFNEDRKHRSALFHASFKLRLASISHKTGRHTREIRDENEAWGHYASCSCRTGAEGDGLAVLDKLPSPWHHEPARGDASVFPLYPRVFHRDPDLHDRGEGKRGDFGRCQARFCLMCDVVQVGKRYTL